jgi:hypothetical protein
MNGGTCTLYVFFKLCRVQNVLELVKEVYNVPHIVKSRNAVFRKSQSTLKSMLQHAFLGEGFTLFLT